MKKTFLLFVLLSIILSCQSSSSEKKIVFSPNISSLNTFGTMGKEQKILKRSEETELFSYSGKGTLTHMWFGGRELDHIDIKIYVDHEQEPSIDMEMYMGHGIGFKDDFAPWGTKRMGNIGGGSGIYNTYKIPFGKHLRITAQLDEEGEELQNFWWIFRGTENLPVQFAGVTLPESARLKLYKLENYVALPLEEFNLFETKKAGMLYQVAMEAKGLRDSNHWKDLSYMEACVRAYKDQEENPLYLSSGLEDYFLGTYYFNKGRFINLLAGLTHFDKEKNEFSAYRLHEDDPIFFQNGMRLTNRCGEKIGDKIFHDPPKTRYTVYSWVYEW